MHRHPYGEVFVVRAGHMPFTVAGKTVDAEAGDVVVAPPGADHRCVDRGPDRLDMVTLHSAGSMSTPWVDLG